MLQRTDGVTCEFDVIRRRDGREKVEGDAKMEERDPRFSVEGFLKSVRVN